MSFLPDFSTDQARRLSRLGVLPAQIDSLRRTLVTVRHATTRGGAHGEIAAVLQDVGKLSAQLSKRLRGNPSKATAHLGAFARIEPIYWKDARVTHDGPHAAAHLCPLLDALADAAASALRGVPQKPLRHKSADPRPIEAIADALLAAWPNDVRVAWLDSDTSPAIASMEAEPAEPFPKKFRPSASPTSTFWKIVGTCYEAVGANAIPERAIKTFLAQRKQQRERDVATFTAGVEKARAEARRTKRP